MVPLCSVITPTWQRHELLLGRCIPHVIAQEYPRVEHVIVSDGPDDKLAWRLGIMAGEQWEEHFLHGRYDLAYRELPEHDPGQHWGSAARLAALEVAHGEYITYCDDDDALRPDHCSLMVAALEADPGAAFAVSRMLSHFPGEQDRAFGWGKLECGNVGTPMIMHRRSVLEHGTWGAPSCTEDWDLVQKWLSAGIGYVNVDACTSDVYPSHYHDPREA